MSEIHAEAPHHDPEALKSAKAAVAQACLENRSALEQVAYIADHEDVFGIEERTAVQVAVREILDALDEWRDASVALLQHASAPIPPPGFEAGGSEVK